MGGLSCQAAGITFRVYYTVHKIESEFACVSPPHVVIQTVNHGTVAFLEHRSAVSVLLVRLHEHAEKEHNTPIPTAIHAYFELSAGPLVERWRRDEEDKVHPHAVMTWKGLTVDKLISEEILVTNVKAAEDLDLSPVLTPASTLGTCTMLQAPHQPSNITAIKLFVLSVRRRKPKARKPMATKVVQIVGYLFAEVFQRWMLLDIISVLRT